MCDSDGRVWYLLNSQVSVDAGVPGRAREVFVLPVGDVDVGPGVPVLFRKTEINYVHQIAFLAKTPENWRFFN